VTTIPTRRPNPRLYLNLKTAKSPFAKERVALQPDVILRRFTKAVKK
jgi:hypothetical protein